MIYAKSISEKINDLPIEFKELAEDFIDMLYKKCNLEKQNSEEFSLKWAGGLSDLNNQYTSIDLQRKANEWRKSI